MSQSPENASADRQSVVADVAGRVPLDDTGLLHKLAELYMRDDRFQKKMHDMFVKPSIRYFIQRSFGFVVFVVFLYMLQLMLSAGALVILITKLM